MATTRINDTTMPMIVPVSSEDIHVHTRDTTYAITTVESLTRVCLDHTVITISLFSIDYSILIQFLLTPRCEGRSTEPCPERVNNK